jgi:hypothetical protein
MSEFYTTIPDQSTFGYEHNYSAWAPNSKVTICKVPWNASYRDIVRFNDRPALNAYIDNAGGETITIEDSVYLKMGYPLDLDVPFNVANTFNYLRVHNPALPFTSPTGVSGPTDFYYFVTGVEFIAGNTTRFNVQLDVWQTFGYEFVFGQSFIERGHIGIAADNAFDEYGRAFLNIPEGMDIGGEYTIAQNWSHSIGTARGGLDYEVLIMSTVALNSPNAGDVDDPGFFSATGSMMENLPSGCSIYLVGAGDFLQLMTALSDKPWISQGIVSITAIPNDSISRYELITGDVVIDGMAAGTVKDIVVGSAVNAAYSFVDDWRDAAMEFIPEQYRHLKKLLTFPYMALEMTTYSGQPIIIKPESWDNPDAVFVELPHLVPGSAKIVFYPEGYNRRAGATPETDALGMKNDAGEFLDMATSISNFPTFSIVNNSTIAYMASNRNSIAFSHQSADWSQQRALTGNQLSFDQASAGMGLTSELNRLNVNAATQSTNLANQTAGFSALQGGANALVSGAMKGRTGLVEGALGAANAGVSFAITANNNNQALNINTSQMNASANAGIANAGYMADTNLAYANFASKGDNQNAIAGIQAKVQDAKLLQPTTQGQVGGDTFNLATYKWGIDLKLKIMQGSAMNQVVGYWMRYGYQMNVWGTLPADMQCMTHFTYWKLRETYVASAACPEAFKETIRGIFEKGVTVWRNPADIGNIAMTDNQPIGGFTL